MGEKRGKNKLDTKVSKIVKENRQLSVRIPAEFASKLRIDTEKDRFMWVTLDNKQGISLHGNLIKDLKNEKKNSK